jgi:anaphase-promoting complex subunit 1
MVRFVFFCKCLQTNVLGVRVRVSQPLNEPPNIFQTLLGYFYSNHSQFLTLEDIAGVDMAGQKEIIPRITGMLSLFELMNHHDTKATTVLEHMLDLGLSRSDIEQYPEGVRFSLLEIIAYSRDKESNGTVGIFKLLERNDIVTMLVDKKPKTETSSSYRDSQADVRHIVQTLGEHDAINAWDGQSENDRIAISRLIYSEDRRFYEVSKLLKSSRVQTATLIQPPDCNEHDWMTMQQSLFKIIAVRTFSIPFGRAALFYSARRPLITEKYPIPKVNLNVIISPSNVTIPAQRPFLTDENLAWGYFHNGVSAGLSVSKDATHISGSWIVFNRPQTLNSQHAGFLLGLGLNGHLRKLEEWHIYNYLGPKHSPTSIALLIGMAASHLGTMNGKLTKVLSVHVAALLPVGSSDLNVAISVQTSGLLGIGLLYCNTQHRRMTEIMLSELDVSCKAQSTTEKDEAYCLAAGISLGLINLGRGSDMKGLIDIHVVERLLKLAVVAEDVQTAENSDLSVPGAIIALLFLFVKSNNETIAEKIDVPDTEHLLEYIRPDFLFLRKMAKSLMLWNTIGTTRSWIEAGVPARLRNRYSIDAITALDSDQLAYFNIIGGLCFSMGVRHAATAKEEVKSTLLWFIDHMMRLCELPTVTYDDSVTKQSLMNCLGSICLALSCVMVGTGDLEVLRRLRKLYGRAHKDDFFGSSVANQTAMGLLFLGGGQFTFGASDLSVAALIMAFYPLLPTQMQDNRSHLQALRHFWVLAAEPRCLVLRDVTTGALCAVPVIVRMKSGEMIRKQAPCLLPSFDLMESISTDCEKHFQVDIKLDDADSPLTRAFLKNQTVFILEKTTRQLTQSTFSLALQTLGDDEQVKSGNDTFLRSLGPISTLDKLQQNAVVLPKGKRCLLPMMYRRLTFR